MAVWWGDHWNDLILNHLTQNSQSLLREKVLILQTL